MVRKASTRGNIKKIKKNTIKHKNTKKIETTIVVHNSFMDNAFLRCYDTNLAKIHDAIAKYSGIHPIDPAMAGEFITRQISKIRRQAARDLIQHTIYITLADVTNIIERLIIKLYTENNNFEGHDRIYMYSGEPKKSFYFMSVLALYYIRRNGYREPTDFIKKLHPDVLTTLGRNPLIMIDDVSYSGSQLSQILGHMYYRSVIEYKTDPPNIYCLLIALTTESKKVISQVPQNYDPVSKGFYNYTESPFRIMYLNHRLYPSLLEEIGIERSFYVRLFFSPFTFIVPTISLYMDHKLADEVSTFQRAIMYGPIVPSNYNYLAIGDCLITQDDHYIMHPREFSITTGVTEPLYTRIMEFKKANPLYTEPVPLMIRAFDKSILKYLILKLKNVEVFDRPITDRIEFRPFINSCNQSPQLIDNITDLNISTLDYGLFMVPKNCMRDEEKCSIQGINAAIRYYKTFIMKLSNLSLRQIITLHDKITNIICPISWYKAGIYDMSTCY